MTKNICILMVTTAMLFPFADRASATAPADFLKKIPISLSASAQTSLGEDTLSGFPVLVRLSAAIANFSYSDVTANGSDIAFGVDDGTTVTFYPYEIDTWNPNGVSLVWVRVPTLAAATSFNMYCGNGVSVANTPSAVWGDYAGVWHLNEASGTAYDSTANALNATASGANSSECVAVSTAPTGTGRQLASVKAHKSYLSIPNYDSLALGGTFAISAWVKADECYDKYSARYFSRKNGYQDKNGWEAEQRYSTDVAVTKTTVSARGANSGDYTGTVPDISQNWVYVVLSYNGTTLQYYVNGAKAETRTLNSAATDNGKPLSIGNDSDGNESNFVGAMDEIRLRGFVPTETWEALEYAMVAQPGCLVYGAAETLDADAPKFSAPPTLSGAGGSFTFTATLAGGEGDLYMVFTDLETSLAVTNTLATGVSTPGDYQGSPTLVSGKGYSYAVLGISPSGTCIVKNGVGPAYAGEITIVKTADASETTMESGSFTVSRGSCTYGDLVVNYTVSGTAVADETYEALSGTVVIPDGSSSAQIEVAPIYNSDVTEDVDVVVTLANGAYLVGSPASATVTVVNSVADPYVRYIAAGGNDNNTGLSSANPMATLSAAIASLDGVSADTDCTICVAAGTYELALSASGATEWSVIIDRRISVVGSTGDPKDVVFQRASTAYGLFRLNNANAALKFITVKDGKAWGNNDKSQGIQKGAGIYLQNGVVEDCIITGATGPAYGQSGDGIYIEAGRVSRCRITACKSGNSAQNGTGVYVAGGIIEDSLIDSNTCADAGAAMVTGSGTMVNCTVVGNTGGAWTGVRASAAGARVVNCAIYGNFASQSIPGRVYTPTYPACYINCASDVPIEGGVNCVSSTRAFADWANGDYCPVAGSPCIDAGTARAAYGTVSETDLAGNPRAVGTVDIGCFENQKSASDVGFTWTANGHIVPATLSVAADSLEIQEPEYTWTLHNSYGGEDIVGSGKSTSFADLTAGIYTITVTAGDKSWTSPDTYQIAPKVLYASADNASAAFPFDTPETAAADIATAFSAASDGSTIYVAPGVYPVSSQLVVDKGVSILGTGRDYESTVVSNTVRSINQVHRIFAMQHADALISNLTMTHGMSSEDGGNAYFYAIGGTISNCLFTCGYVQGNYQQSGGGAAMVGGLITHCEFKKCNAMPSSATGSSARVLQLSGGDARVSNCYIHDCDATDRSLGTKTYIGKGHLVGMTLNTCFDNNTIVGCIAPTNGPVISGTAYNGAYTGCSRVINCAIFGNVDAAGDIAKPFNAGIVYAHHWTTCVRNCASDIEIGEDRTKTDQAVPAGHYSAADSVVTTKELAFVNYANGDYRPVKDGPLYNAGANDLVAFSATDFGGRKRVNKQIVDIGCYEYNPPAETQLIVR